MKNPLIRVLIALIVHYQVKYWLVLHAILITINMKINVYQSVLQAIAIYQILIVFHHLLQIVKAAKVMVLLAAHAIQSINCIQQGQLSIAILIAMKDLTNQNALISLQVSVNQELVVNY